MRDGVAERLAPLLTRMLGSELPVKVRAWDGSEIGPEGVPVFVIRDRRALRRLLWKPGEVGLVRAYVAGELDIEGDICTALGALQRVMRRGDEPITLTGDDKREIVRAAVTLGAVGPEPKAPPEENAGNLLAETSEELYLRMLGPSRSYGHGLWHGAVTLEEAQLADQLDLAARLALKPGSSVLDLGAPWGSFPELLRRDHEVTVEGPDLGGGPYDLVLALAASMPLHRLTPKIAEVLRPGGRLIARQVVHRQDALLRPITSDYVLPEGAELPTLGSLAEAFDAAGLEIRQIRAMREDYARTLRAWAANLQRTWTDAEEGRARVWLLHLATTALACESGRIGLYELDAVLR